MKSLRWLEECLLCNKKIITTLNSLFYLTFLSYHRATEKDDKFDKGKFETEINKIGVKLDNDDNDSVIVKSTRPGKTISV